MSVSLTVAAKHGHIANSPAFAPLPWNAPEERDNLELTGVTMHVAADHQIYAEGDEARSFYKVVSGVVRTCRFLSDGRRQIDSFHRAGDVFGFEAGADHRMSAEAVTECTVIAYRRRGMGGIDARTQHIEGIAKNLEIIFARSHAEELPTGMIAREIAETRLN